MPNAGELEFEKNVPRVIWISEQSRSKYLMELPKKEGMLGEIEYAPNLQAQGQPGDF